MRYAVSTALCLAVVLSARAAWPQEGPAAEVERLRAKVAALERRVAELEAQLRERRPSAAVTVEVRPDQPDAKPALNGPLTDERRAEVEKATAEVARLAADVRQFGGTMSRTPKLSRDATVGRWADASRKLATLYAEYGQEAACLTALTRFEAWSNKSYGSQKAFDAAAFECAATFATQWEEPKSAMRFAARYGPKSRTRGGDWGKLCEAAAEATGKRSYKELALKCYLRAAVSANDQAAFQRARVLEAELKSDR